MNLAIADDGAELKWAEEGTGEPLLLVAGQATGMAGWGPTAAALAEHFRVLRFDHRGIGGSSQGDADRYTTRFLAADAASVLQSAEVDSAHVYGHSMGGRVAQWLAIDHAERVRTLILASTSAGRGAVAGPDPEAAAALISGDHNRMSPYFFDPDWAAQNPEAVRTFFDSGASAWAKSRHFAASRNHDALEYLPLIQAPTLILHGDQDLLSPLPNAQLRQSLWRSTLVKVRGAGHGLHLDHPETVEWIRQFINGKSRPRD